MEAPRCVPGADTPLLVHPDTPAGAAIRRATVDLLVDHGFGVRDALLASSTVHTHLLERLAVEAIPATTGGDGEPSWRSHGLSAADYTAHGVRTVIEGLRALHG